MYYRDIYGVNKFVQEHGGVENFRCFAQMSYIDARIPSMGIAIVSDRTTWVECKIDESQYKIDESYEITLRPLVAGFAKEDFDHYDFISMIREGWIIPKTREDQRVEHVTYVEPLCGAAFLVHEGDMIVPVA